MNRFIRESGGSSSGFRRDKVSVTLIDTKSEYWEDEREYIRSKAAVDALMDLARKLGGVVKE